MDDPDAAGIYRCLRSGRERPRAWAALSAVTDGRRWEVSLIARLERQPELAVAVIYVTALFITILDSTIVQVALPRMADDFGVSAVSIGWVVVGYLVSMAVWIPASGWVGDRAGTKRILLGALGLFTLASILCGLSGSLEQLIAFRLLQGAAAGMVSPVATAMLFRAFPPERRANW